MITDAYNLFLNSEVLKIYTTLDTVTEIVNLDCLLNTITVFVLSCVMNSA